MLGFPLHLRNRKADPAVMGPWYNPEFKGSGIKNKKW
jgi:hypothetical protein